MNKQLVLEIYKSLLAGAASKTRGAIDNIQIKDALDGAKRASEKFEEAFPTPASRGRSAKSRAQG